MFCRTDSIMKNILHIQFECEEYSSILIMFYEIFLIFSLNVKILCRIVPVPYNIVMALNKVMIIS
jgi:hypothetical protein